jgi:hypothetical protein
VNRRRFLARRISRNEAAELWNSASTASAFIRPDYLELLAADVEWWGVEHSGKVVAAWPLVRAMPNSAIAPPPFCYNVGPIFSKDLQFSSYHRQWSTHREVFSALVAAVVSEHSRFSFSLPLGLQDVRVLQWWNFDHPGRIGFSFRPRYTARVCLSELKDDAALLRTFSSNRRQVIRLWMANPPVQVDNVPDARLIQLHDTALERSGGLPDATRGVMLRRIIDLVRSGAGATLGFRPEEQDEVVAAVILLDGSQESNAVFYGAEPDWRNRGLTSWAVWQAMRHARDSGKRWFDFNGANSPGRAADKHFYGAGSELYFDCTFGPT